METTGKVKTTEESIGSNLGESLLCLTLGSY